METIMNLRERFFNWFDADSRQVKSICNGDWTADWNFDWKAASTKPHMSTMKLSEITHTGFYWNRLDEHRAWTVVFVDREAKNPVHPKYNTMIIRHMLMAPNSLPHHEGEFIGPIEPPAEVV